MFFSWEQFACIASIQSQQMKYMIGRNNVSKQGNYKGGLIIFMGIYLSYLSCIRGTSHLMRWLISTMLKIDESKRVDCIELDEIISKLFLARG